jgi:sec-independent protein translocase protein TatA
MFTGWERPSHWLVLAVVVVVLFGYKKLPDVTRSVGKSLRIFKTEMKGMDDDDTKRQKSPDAAVAPTSPAAPVAPPADIVPPPTATALAADATAIAPTPVAPPSAPAPAPASGDTGSTIQNG